MGPNLDLVGGWSSQLIFFLIDIYLEKEMATHSSLLAWRIPWTEESGGLRLWGRTELDTTEAI